MRRAIPISIHIDEISLGWFFVHEDSTTSYRMR